MAESQGKEESLRAHLSTVLQELQEAAQGQTIRRARIRQIEGFDPAAPRRLLTYVANADHPASQLTAADVVPLGDALASIGKADRLDVLLHTPGGSGDMAEKFIEMCRRHCSGELRVIVPNMAKSAGTLIALGADAIVMGYCSELGPIDPQIPIMVGSQLQWVSAWTFIRTRDLLQQKAQEAIAKNENPAVYLQQLAGVDPVFVTHCEQLMTFAKQLVRKFILGRLHDEALAEEHARQVVDFLSNVEEHITHGRLVSASELQKHCGQALSVCELQEVDGFWQLLWELYVRCEVFLKQPPQPKAKLIETADVSIALG